MTWKKVSEAFILVIFFVNRISPETNQDFDQYTVEPLRLGGLVALGLPKDRPSHPLPSAAAASW